MYADQYAPTHLSRLSSLLVFLIPQEPRGAVGGLVSKSGGADRRPGQKGHQMEEALEDEASFVKQPRTTSST